MTSDYSYDRALWTGLLDNVRDEIDKEEFKQEVQKQLGLAPGQDCDSICGAMDDQEFEQFIEYVKETIRNKKKKQQNTRIEQPIYA